MKTVTAKVLLACAAMLLQWALFSCSSGPTGQNFSPTGPAPATSQPTGTAAFAALPAPRSLLHQPGATAAGNPRGASEITEAGLLRGGDDFDVSLKSNLVQNSSSGDFSPSYVSGGPASGLAYGLYRFDAHDYDRQQSIRLRWSATPQVDKLWLGLGNLTSNRWDWVKPSTAQLANLDAQHQFSNYISVTGELLLVVLLTGNQGATLDALRLGDPLLTPDFTIDAGLGHFTFFVPRDIELKSTSLIGSGSITNYEWDLDGDGVFETDTDLVDEIPTLNVSDGGEFDVSLRLTSDWGTTSEVSHTLRGIVGNWLYLPLTNSVNDGMHQTSVRSPQLLGSRSESLDIPVVVWGQTDVQDPAGLPTYDTSVKTVLLDDPTLESATPAAPALDDIGGQYDFTVDQAVRLSGGQPAIICRDSSGGNTLIYTHADSPGASAWESPVPLAAMLDSFSSSSLQVINGDLYCTYTRAGNILLRSNMGTLNPDWSMETTVHTSSANFFAIFKPVLQLGINVDFLPKFYCCCESNDSINSTNQPIFLAADSAAAMAYHGKLESASPSGASMCGTSYYSRFYSIPRSMFAYADLSANSRVDYAYDATVFENGGELEQGTPVTSFLSPGPGEVSLSGSMDPANDLADVMLAFSTIGGGLYCYLFFEGAGWITPGSGEIEPQDPGDAGSQPCCAWVDGRPAVVYVDYATQNVKFAMLQ